MVSLDSTPVCKKNFCINNLGEITVYLNRLIYITGFSFHIFYINIWTKSKIYIQCTYPLQLILKKNECNHDRFADCRMLFFSEFINLIIRVFQWTKITAYYYYYYKYITIKNIYFDDSYWINIVPSLSTYRQ